VLKAGDNAGLFYWVFRMSEKSVALSKRFSAPRASDK
jgi:hypothetical protein